MTEETVVQVEKDLLREKLCKYTRKAFQMLPKLDKPRILDIGCGSGVATIELARLSKGEIIGIDIDQPALDRFTRKIEQAGLSGRVRAMNCSMFNMNFTDEGFDIIWSEGSIFIIGFERGLRDWRQFLKPGGFMVIHEMIWLQTNPPRAIYDYWKSYYPGIKTVPENLKQITNFGYRHRGHFTLPEDAWWSEYYGPLERRIKELRAKHNDHPSALLILDKEQGEIDIARKYHKWYSSAFFVMQKR
jgi:ubiquinone/menaquinone biosynthesis C-methylase UbiE